jgi:hypothetical protein
MWVGAGATMSLFRQAGTPSYDTIWAEDGGVFLQGAVLDPVGSIADRYTGYMHFVPRVVALVAATLPLEHAAEVFAVGSAVMVALLGAYVYVASAGILRTRWARLALGALVMLAPGAAYETANNATNLRWYLLFASFWALVFRPPSMGWSVVRGMLLVATALSDPLAVLLVPMAVWAWRREGTAARWPVVAFAGALLVQGAIVVASLVRGVDTPLRVGGFELLDAIGLFGLRVGGAFAVGNAAIRPSFEAIGWAFAAVGWAFVLLVCAYAWSRRDLPGRALVPLMFGLAALLFAVPLLLRGTSELLPHDGRVTLLGLRWTVTPILLLQAVLLMALERRDPRAHPAVWRGLQAVVMVGLAVQILANYRVTNPRSEGPSWDAQVAAAERRCTSDPLDRTTLLISPQVRRGVWGVTLPCSEFRLESAVTP